MIEQLAEERARLEPLRSTLGRLVDRGRLRTLPDGRFTNPPMTRSTAIWNGSERA